MKKFFFSLNTVLNYKEQVLESLRGEHVAALLIVRACEREIEALEDSLSNAESIPLSFVH